MPAIVAFFVRQLILIGVQLGIFSVIDKWITPLVNDAIAAIVSFFGVNEETAKDVLANEIIETAESLGLTVALSRAKLPLAVADKLGFTTKGFKKRTLPATVAAKVETAGGSAATKTTAGVVLSKGLLTITGGLLAWNVLTDWVWIGNTLNFLPDDASADIQKRALTIKQLIDTPRTIVYSAEKSRRQLSQQERELIRTTADEAEKQINDLQRVYAEKFLLYGRADVLSQLNNSTITLRLELQTLRQIAGLIPRQEIKKIKLETVVAYVFDGDTIKLDTGETVRLLGIDAPESTTPAGEVSKKYLKERLIGKMVRIESDPDALIDIYQRRLGVVYLDDININIEMLQKKLASFYFFEPNALVFKKQWEAAAKGTTTETTTYTAPRVFTGIISQGKLGAEIKFTPRPDDLISDINELQEAAQNNLAPFLATLPGRVVYEIKTASSVTTKDGFTQRGTTQRIISGYYKNGTAKYKTVTNKFAVINLYILTERNARTKIASIVLGPTDAAKFNPQPNELTQIENTVKASITTSDIKTVQSVTPTTTLPLYQTIGYGAAGAEKLVVTNVGGIWHGVTNWKQIGINRDALPTVTPTGASGANQTYEELQKLYNSYQESISTTQSPQTLTASNATTPTTQKQGTNAETLSEWYTANGLPLPTVSERAVRYAQLELGQASYYTGTAEQNTKLLAALKAK